MQDIFIVPVDIALLEHYVVRDSVFSFISDIGFLFEQFTGISPITDCQILIAKKLLVLALITDEVNLLT